MSIATEISRLQTAKANIKSAIETRGVSVPSGDTLDDYAPYIIAIPDRYQILEYIQSDGTFYIPTSIYLTNSMWFDYKFQLATLPEANQNQHICSGSVYRIGQIRGNSTFYIRRGDAGGVGNSILINSGHLFTVGDDRCVVAFKNNNDVSVDGTVFGTLAAVDTPTDSATASVFDYNNSLDPATYAARGKLYYLKIGTGNTLSYNFIPAKRKSDNNIGLYDAVNDVFYPSVSVS